MWRFGASLDHLLPIVELDKEFAKFFEEKLGEYGPKARVYFVVHAALGFILGGFVAAGLGGLTQAQ